MSAAASGVPSPGVPSPGAAPPFARLQGAVLRATRRQDLVLAAVLIAAVALMVLPVPTPVVDLLIGFNMGMAVLLLMVSVYLRTPLDFAALPGVILISTVFRLSMAVTTTRLILVQADAGHIVEAFGEFVISGNLVVGLVVFLIITIVQFVVVTKGAERVAEVGARFTLDALPGKQMSIDADLRSGDIDGAEARRRRRTVEKESQFHGAMDGAMKFVKGDAIAGLIIILVNLVGGIGIGTVQRGLSLGEAGRIYTLLTVGDALISQIPALFLSITAAIIVTRVGGDGGNLGDDIVGQLASDKRALRLSAAVMLGMAFVPGFPAPVFVFLALVFGASSLTYRGGARGAPAPGAVPAGGQAGDAAHASAKPPASAGRAPPLAVRLSPGLAGAIGAGSLDRPLRLAREQVHEELGFAAPEATVTTDPALEGLRYAIDLEGVPVEGGEGRPDRLLLRDDPIHLGLLGVTAEAGPPLAGAGPSHWVDAAEAGRLAGAGIGYNTCPEAIALRARAVLRANAPGFLGIQETKALLAAAERDYAELVREVLRVLPIQKLAEVLRRLLEEGVSIRNTRLILEALAEWAERESRVLLLAEYVRNALSRQICHRHASVQKLLAVLILEQEAEQAVRQALRETAVGVYLAMDAETSDLLVAQVKTCMANVSSDHVNPVIVCSMDVRRYVRGLLTKNGMDVPVLSYQNLSQDFSMQVVGSVGLSLPGDVYSTAPADDEA